MIAVYNYNCDDVFMFMAMSADGEQNVEVGIQDI